MRLAVGALALAMGLGLVGCPAGGASSRDGSIAPDRAGGDVETMEMGGDRAGEALDGTPDRAASGGAPGGGGGGGTVDRSDAGAIGGAANGGGAGSPGTDGGTELDGATPGTDGGALSSCLGTCLEGFLQQCPKTNQSCTTAMSGTDVVNCYANGVKQRSESTAADASRTIKKANGEVCYTSIGGQTSGMQTIKDTSGNVVAELMFNSASIVTVFCMSDVKVVDLLASPCAAYASAPKCVAGECTW